jgi:hypothetical protein
VPGLFRGGSSKGPAISFGKETSSVKVGAPPALSRGDSFKRGVGKSQKGSKIIEPDSLADGVPLQLPPPDVFLLLRSVNAQEMALLYLDIADKLRRDTLIEKMRRRKPSVFAGASFGHAGNHSREKDAPHEHGIAHELTPVSAATTAVPRRPSSIATLSSFPPNHRKQSAYAVATTAAHGVHHGAEHNHGARPQH